MKLQAILAGVSREQEAAAAASPEAAKLLAARCAVLELLAILWHLSPPARLAAVRAWDGVAALFALLWEQQLQAAAQQMVRLIQCFCRAEKRF